MSMFINFDIDDMNESEIHSLKQENKKLKTQIEERDFCIRELQIIIEKIQKTLEEFREFEVLERAKYSDETVDEVILLCNNSEDSVIQKIKERRNK